MDLLGRELDLGPLFESSPNVTMLYDREGCVVRANPAAIELAGYTLDELIGTNMSRHVPARDRAALDEARRSALDGVTQRFETTIRTKAGQIVPLACTMFAARAGNGDVFGVFITARDLGASRAGSLFEHYPDGIMEVTHAGAVSRVNAALESMTGLYADQLVGLEWSEIIAPESRAAATEMLQEAMRGEPGEGSSVFLDRLGNRIDVQIKFVPLSVGVHVTGAYVVAKDVSAQLEAERTLVEQNERIRALYMLATGQGGVAEQIDAALELGCRWFGFEFGYVSRIDDQTLTVLNVAGPQHSVTPGAVFPRSLVVMRKLTAKQDSVLILNLEQSTYRDNVRRLALPWKSCFALMLRVHGRPFGTMLFADRNVRTTPLSQTDRELAHLIGVFVAAALEHAEYEQRVEHLAFYDSLTGLPNRVLFDERIRQTMVEAHRYERSFAVMYMDLDFFKRVNDDLGHGSGDLLLQSVAQRLRETVRESDTVARFGGDEFVVLQPSIGGASDTSDMARKIVAAMQKPFVLSGKSLDVHVSIGISIYPNDGGTVEELTNNADKALYRAKHSGRNRWVFFDEEEQRRQWPAVKNRPT
ncbi:MAG: diguanylate cyclase [Candidatus Eremiobacteraeota bacterium]|nr:diguanylate cyclase [Candidatus Eremiobacteraeota bacterium]